jgi:hypothetical protein
MGAPGPIPRHSAARNAPIPHGDRDRLHTWLRLFVGIDLAREPVCAGHSAPFDAFSDIYFDKPESSVILGPRGGGKSLMSALQTHLECRFRPRYGARIMGGSEQQSRQIYDAINNLIVQGHGPNGSDGDQIESLLSKSAIYKNGSTVAMLAASMRSARGPHVPRVCLDEIDEIKKDIFESAVGMAQEDTRLGHPTQVVMTSTWHHANGLMAAQLAQARSGAFPVYEFCVFEVLERCPEDRSGPRLEKCPECPIQKWCHEDIEVFRKPKAKRSNGHYSISSFIQKALILGDGAIQADYLCRGPRHESLWFRSFSEDNVATPAELARGVACFSPRHETYIPIDYGVETGSVAFQIRKRALYGTAVDEVHVFGDYYNDGAPARVQAKNQKTLYESLMSGQSIDEAIVTMDPAGGGRNPVGPTGISEYREGGIRNINWWPNMTGRKKESLALVDSFLFSGAGQAHLKIHPRCTMLIKSFREYSRKQVGDIILPEPKDPQHPWEEMIDALSGGLLAKYPNGRTAAAPGRRVHIAGLI